MVILCVRYCHHLLFFGVFAYMAGFVGNFLVPKSIDSVYPGSTSKAIVINVLLLALFAAQHSSWPGPHSNASGRASYQNRLSASTYVFASNVVTIVLMWQWRGIDQVVWNAQHPMLRGLLWGLFAIGWLLVPLVSSA